MTLLIALIAGFWLGTGFVWYQFDFRVRFRARLWRSITWLPWTVLPYLLPRRIVSWLLRHPVSTWFRLPSGFD